MNDVSTLEGAELDAAVLECLRDPVSGNVFYNGSGDFSRDWASGGPIIERERIAVAPGKPGEWMAFKQEPGADGGRHWPGPTPLIAAMRAFVASKQTG